MGKAEDELVKKHEVQLSGDPLNNDDLGIIGDIKAIRTKVGSIDSEMRANKKWVSGIVAAALISAFTYLADMVINYNGDSFSNNNNSSYNMGNDSKLLRRGQPSNNIGDKQLKNGN